MNQFMAVSTMRMAGASPVNTVSAGRSSQSVAASAATERINVAVDVGRIQAAPDTTAPGPAPESLPWLGHRTGSLFADRVDPALYWYLPDVCPHDDPDSAFAFAATQSGQDQNGNPFYIAQLSVTAHRIQPADVTDYSKANPSVTVREIPLTELTATLTSFYTDDNGSLQQRDAVGTVKDAGGGDLVLTFGPILGASVIGIYQDLSLFAKAQIRLAAFYRAWVTLNRPGPVRPQFFAVPVDTLAARPMVAAAPMTDAVSRPIAEARPGPMRPIGLVALQRYRALPSAPNPIVVESRQSWESLLQLGLKYHQDGYQLKYTVSTGNTPSQVIRDANDLRDFNHAGSEFRELKALGELSQRYPSLSRAYIGALSRTIVVIPDRYSILRSRIGCSASCLALVDSGASNGSLCKFEFDFTVAPEVSRTEFLQFAQEVANNADLSGYQLKFADFLQSSPASTLQTAFKSNVQFAAGTDAHTFIVSVSIQDDGSQTPAVANANLFIAQLCASVGPGLIGSLNLKLDDGYPDPVLAKLVLNFAHTAGSDELDYEVDAPGGQIKVTNLSRFDLQIARYALASTSGLTVTTAPIQLAASSTVSIPLPSQQTASSMAVDAQLLLPAVLKKADVAQYLTFQTADVQTTQYVIAIDAGGVSFDKVDSIVASVTFATLSSVTPPTLNLSKFVHADSTHIIIPLENAVFTLPGQVNLTIKYADGSTPDLHFTTSNDFAVQPVLVLLQSDIDAAHPT